MTTREQVFSLLLDHPNASYEKIGSIVHCSRQRVHQIAKSAGLTKERRLPYYRSDVTIDRVQKLYYSDLLMEEMVKILGCCLGTVRRRLREAGIKPSKNRSRSMKIKWRGKLNYRNDVTVSRVLSLYHDDWLIGEIAQTLGCSPFTVRYRLREAGISPSERLSRGAVIKWKRRKGNMPCRKSSD